MMMVSVQNELKEIGRIFNMVSKPAANFAWKAMAIAPTLGILINQPWHGLGIGVCVSVGVLLALMTKQIEREAMAARPQMK